jgi:hypothetical protein
MQGNRLRPIGEEIPAFFGAEAEQPQPTPPPPQQPSQSAQHAATSMLLLALRALSQRALVAITQLFTLITVGSAWWLWYAALPNPTITQLVELGLYGVLILLLNWLVLKR